jgi:hypothetical protein
VSRKRVDRVERAERVAKLDRLERRGAAKETRARSPRAAAAPHPDDAAPTRGSSFRCHHCHRDVPMDALGTQHRNHCPFCLWSRHVDDEPGDRASECLASMEPIAISVRKDGEWVLIHRCNGCGELSSNRTAGDDNPLLLLRIAVKPLAQPPFPLDRLAQI